MRSLQVLTYILLLLVLDRRYLGRAFVVPPPIPLPLWRSSLRPFTVLSARNRKPNVARPIQKPSPLEDEERWFPRRQKTKVVYDDDIYGSSSDDLAEEGDDIEIKGAQLMARLLSQRIGELKMAAENPAEEGSIDDNQQNKPLAGTALRNFELAKGRFIDLACSLEGEQIMENLFLMGDAAKEKDPRVIQAAVMGMQSICIMGTQVGLKGSPDQIQRMIAHLDNRGDQNKFKLRDLETWDTDSVRRLKYQLNRVPGTQVMAEMLWRRNSQGAFELLEELGAWKKHEDLALLRSGFSLRFNEREIEAASIAAQSTRDPDEALGLRKDLRHLKVFTVDSAATSEIDDGISLEKYTDDQGTERERIWIHIADAERWVPRKSNLFEIARRRVTSLYLPQGTIPMLPPEASDEVMSLIMNRDSFALSLGVELNADGSIDDSSILVTPSLIRVSYRLTYDEVDEMLEEGIGYNEERELGALLNLATTRRKYRCSHGSSEGLVPTPIPQYTICIPEDDSAPDGIRIEVLVQSSHNAGANQTAGAETTEGHKSVQFNVEPVSSAFTLVTESMIVAGEAIGRWKVLQDTLWEGLETTSGFRNEVRLPFRAQKKPDYSSRARERAVMKDLFEYNTGGGYCYAWYYRRFLSPVKVSETLAPHSGLGLSAYVQWTSPIRRYADLIVHISVKRFLRRQRIHELLTEGKTLDGLDILPEDIGCSLPSRSAATDEYTWKVDSMDADIDYSEGSGLMGASRLLQRQSEQYWMLEYIRRIHAADSEKVWEALTLGYIGEADKSKKSYAIYIYELGLEWRISSPINLGYGVPLKLRVSTIAPRAGQLVFVRISG